MNKLKQFVDDNKIFLLKASVVIIFLIFGYLHYYKKESFENYSGICVFDLDDTLTCGIARAADAVKTCKQLNCKIAINTARPTAWWSDIKLTKLGLDESDFIDDFYHGEKFSCSFQDYKCLSNSVSDTKVKHLKTLSKKWNIDPKKVILFDDQYPNIEKARNFGFSAIYANDNNCGIRKNASKEVARIINN